MTVTSTTSHLSHLKVPVPSNDSNKFLCQTRTVWNRQLVETSVNKIKLKKKNEERVNMSSATNSTDGINCGRLRRSARAPKKPTAEYSVGDLVEVRCICCCCLRILRLTPRRTRSMLWSWIVWILTRSRETLGVCVPFV
jgi:hypothetical protein